MCNVCGVYKHVSICIHCVIYSQELEWFLISRMFENF